MRQTIEWIVLAIMLTGTWTLIWRYRHNRRYEEWIRIGTIATGGVSLFAAAGFIVMVTS